MLLTGDAHPELLAASINRLCGERGIERLAVDVVKIPHHGAAGNTSDEFLATVDCPVWLVSTNGRVFGHPSATAIARILSRQRNPTIGFNYRSRAALWTDVAATGACTIVQPDIGRDGTLVVELPLTSSAGKLGDS